MANNRVTTDLETFAQLIGAVEKLKAIQAEIEDAAGEPAVVLQAIRNILIM